MRSLHTFPGNLFFRFANPVSVSAFRKLVRFILIRWRKSLFCPKKMKKAKNLKFSAPLCSYFCFLICLNTLHASFPATALYNRKFHAESLTQSARYFPCHHQFPSYFPHFLQIAAMPAPLPHSAFPRLFLKSAPVLYEDWV